MRVTISEALCEGNAVCVALAEDVFGQEGVGTAFLHVDSLTVDQVENVRRAIDGCPRQAIALIDD